MYSEIVANIGCADFRRASASVFWDHMTLTLNAVITGASSGIGRATAIAIAKTKGSLFLVGRDVRRLEETVALARAQSPSISLFRCDLAQDAQMENLAEHVGRSFSGVNVLIHCAAIHSTGSFEELTSGQLDALYRLNVRAPYALTRSLLHNLKFSRGQIVFLNSSQGLNASVNCGAYAATKHALKALADSLRLEVNDAGIRVLSVFPGRTATPLTAHLYATESRHYQPELLLQPDDIAAVIVHALQLPRTAEITDVHMRPLAKSY